MTDTVTKMDHRQIKEWLFTLRRVLPIIPSRDGMVLTADDRLALHFLLGPDPLNEGKAGMTAHEAFALAGILENLQGIVDAAASQQRDMVMLRRALMKLSPGHPLVEETEYIEGRT